MEKHRPQIKHLPRFLKKQFFWFIANLYRNSTILPKFFISQSTIWRMTGCHVGKNVRFGLDVYYDVGNADKIYIEDDVWIASRALLLCHRRNMKEYFKYEPYKELPYIKKDVVLKKGCCVSMGAMIMPGVTVGEGAVVGAYSLVTKDVPAWTVVAGNPAKVIYEIKERNK